jgi:RNA-splicing ligase RtcB
MAQLTETTIIEPKMHDVVKTLVRQQLAVLSAGSRLASLRKEVGELKKERDGTIAELARLEVDLTHMELPFGLTRDERGYVVAIEEEAGEDE